jgi:hypothetical protein
MAEVSFSRIIAAFLSYFRSYRARSIASKAVIPENASAFIRDRKECRPELVTIPDNAFGASGMTPPACEASNRI